MFGSQALETAIGLVLMFFVIALASSSIVEIYSRLLKKRGKDLEAVITVMLLGSGTKPTDPGAAPATPGTEPKPQDPNAPTPTEREKIEAWQAKKTAHDTWATNKRAYDTWTLFSDTSVFSVLQAATKTRASTGFLGLRNLIYRAIRRMKRKPQWQPPTKFPSYVSAKSFADAVSEIIVDKKELDDLPEGLAKRLTPIIHEVGADATKIKAGVERWFDDTMERMEGAYKRWATVGLFVTGLILSIAANAGTIDVARNLWSDPATREAVAAAATGVAGSDRAAQCPADEAAATTAPTTTTAPTVDCQIKSVAGTVDTLDSLGLPVGWDKEMRSEFAPWYEPWSWSATGPETASAVLGWLLTALLVMLGAPFWFDLLTKLVALRSSGTKPTTAANDPSSNTTSTIRTESATTLVQGVALSLGSAPTNDPSAALKQAFGLQ